MLQNIFSFVDYRFAPFVKFGYLKASEVFANSRNWPHRKFCVSTFILAHNHEWFTSAQSSWTFILHDTTTSALIDSSSSLCWGRTPPPGLPHPRLWGWPTAGHPTPSRQDQRHLFVTYTHRPGQEDTEGHKGRHEHCNQKQWTTGGYRRLTLYYQEEEVTPSFHIGCD